jgi:hypothetical protein
MGIAGTNIRSELLELLDGLPIMLTTLLEDIKAETKIKDLIQSYIFHVSLII